MDNSKLKNRSMLVSQIHAHCASCGTRTCSILKDCPADTLDKLSFSKKCIVFLRGQRILTEGEISGGIYFIHSGRVKIYKTGTNDKELIVRFAKSGEVLGFTTCERGERQTSTAMALEDTLVCYLDNRTFLHIVRDYPNLALNLLKYYNELLNQSIEQSLKLARMPVTGRIAGALYNLYRTYGTSGKSRRLNMLVSRQDMADLVGTSKEQISKSFSSFKSWGILDVKGRQIDILNLEALEKLSEAEE